jgi:hypothetical protein
MPQNADKQIAGEKKSQDTMLESLLHRARVHLLLYTVHGKHASPFENKKRDKREINCSNACGTLLPAEHRRQKAARPDRKS